MTLSKVEELIAQERGKLEDALAQAVERRDVANREVKRIRAELDAAPRLHVRRTRKAKADSAEPCCGEFDTGSGMHGDECPEGEEAQL